MNEDELSTLIQTAASVESGQDAEQQVSTGAFIPASVGDDMADLTDNQLIELNAIFGSQEAEEQGRDITQLGPKEIEDFNNSLNAAFGNSGSLPSGDVEVKDDGDVVQSMPGNNDTTSALNQAAIRGVISTLDLPPLVWNALSWGIKKSGGPNARVAYPSKVIGELTGLGSKEYTEWSLDPLKAAAAQTFRDTKGAIVEMLGGEVPDENKPLTFFGDEITADDLSLQKNMLDAEEKSKTAPYEFAIELASSGFSMQGALRHGAMNSIDSAKEALPMIQKLGLPEFLASGRLIPRRANDFARNARPVPAGGPSNVATVLASPKANTVEAALIASTSLSATVAGLATDGNPLAMSAAAIAIPSVFLLGQGVKGYWRNKRAWVEAVTSNEAKISMAIDNIFRHATNKDEVMKVLRQHIASGQKLPVSLGALTGDKGLLSFEKGFDGSGTYRFNLSELDKNATQHFGSVLDNIQEQGSQQVFNNYMRARIAAEEEDIASMLDEARKNAEYSLTVNGTKYENLEEANKELSKQLDLITQNIKEKESSLWSEVGEDGLVNVSEVYRNFKAKTDELQDTLAAERMASQGYTQELRILKDLAKISDDVAGPVASSTPSLMKQLIKDNAVKLTKKEANEYGYDNPGWYYIDPATNSPMGTNHATKKDLVADIENSPFDYGIDIKSTSEAVGSTKQASGPVEDVFVRVKELTDLRSVINAKTRQLQSSTSGETNLNSFNAAFASNFQSTLLNAIESVQDVSPAYKEAANYTRNLHQILDKTAFNLSKNQDQIIDSKVLKSNERGAQTADELIAIEKFSAQEGIESGAALRAETGEMILASFAKSAISNGVVNNKDAVKFLDTYASFLSRYPEARAKIEEVVKTGQAMDLAEISASATRSNRQKSIAANMVDTPDLSKTIKALLNDSIKGGQAKAIDNLFDDISKSENPQEALEGFRRIFLDEVTQSMSITSLASRRKLEPIFKQVFGEEKYKLIQEVYESVDKIASRSKVPPSYDEYYDSLLMTTIGKVAGAEVGSKFGQSPLIMANVGGRVMQKLVSEMPREAVQGLTEEMLLNPEKFLEYVDTVDTIKSPNQAVPILNQWLIIAGFKASMTETPTQPERKQ
jgi:hypothetical protein